MTTDIGKGDVVAALRDMSVGPRWIPYGSGVGYQIKAGQRAIVAGIVTAAAYCTECGHDNRRVGLVLEEYPLAQHVYWCPCEWKKLGPGQAETVALFAGALKARPNLIPAKPAKVKA